MRTEIVLIIIGFIMVVGGSWPSIVDKYFPANLPFCMIGGLMIGMIGHKLLKRLFN